MSGIHQILLGGSQAPAVDPYFYSVTSLLHGDGTNGGQNNTFLDSSTNNFTITRNGNTTQGSFSPFSQTGWSNYFQGSGNYLTLADATQFNLSGAAYTIECWIYPNGDYGNYNTIVAKRALSSSSTAWELYLRTGSGVLSFYNGTNYESAITPPSNQWSHIAAVYDGTNINLYLNGVRVLQSAITNSNISASVFIGTYPSYDERYIGYISNLRITKGAALYTGTSFTVPTARLTTTVSAGTVSLLTCQSNRFIDNSVNAAAITITGSPSTQPFTPFNPATPYSTSAVGGSGYFDGSGDFITAPSNAAFDFGTGDFTLEAWGYRTSSGAYGFLISRRAADVNYGPFSMGLDGSNAPYFACSSSGSSWIFVLTGSALPLNTWFHLAGVRNGNTFALYVNGTSVGTATSSASLMASSVAACIGAHANGSEPFAGYISNARIVKGTAVYTANFTPPTAPLTAITNTSLLCNFTNGAIFDNAAVADYETVGNAQISTSVKKYGTGSIAFDGTGDYLSTPATQQTTFRGDFTVEFWLYFAGTTSNFITLLGGTTANTQMFITTKSNGQGIRFGLTGVAEYAAGSITWALNTWYHVALVRVNNNVKFYVNGTNISDTTAGYTNSTTYSGTLLVGGGISGIAELNGYIDDLRISNGYARYTYNFTPPTAEFPNIGGTVTLTADPYYEYTTLLLPGNGTNGAQNNTFLDSSTNNFTITRNGNTTQGTFSPFSQTGWGNYFSGGYLTFTGTSAVNLYAAQFTFECWVYKTSTGLSQHIYGYNNATFDFWDIYIDTSERIVFRYNGNSANITTTQTVPLAQWTHVAVTYDGTTSRVFINGLLAGSAASGIVTANGNYTANIGINLYTGGVSPFYGYMSNMRIIKGSALYTANFTPPTAALTAVSGTSLLTCQSNRFVDNSTNAYALTATSSPSVQAFSPFNPTASWSAATNGGSGYFDGSGDYLDTSTSSSAFAIGTGQFTVEAWVYTTDTVWALVSSTTTGGLVFGYNIDSGTQGLSIYRAGVATAVASNVQIPYGAWTHIAVTRDGSSNVRFYSNGVQIGSTTNNTTDFGTGNQVFRVGADGVSPGSYIFTGYAASVRVIKGAAQYTGTTYTVPTAPLEAIANTSLLLNFTNAGIYDATSKNDLETVGNAQISTTQSKFGGSSMYFDGTGDWLAIPATQNIVFGTADFTIEMWVYSGSQSSTSVRMMGNGAGGSWASGKYVLTTTSATNPNKFTFGVNNASPADLLVSTTTFNDSTWRHVAITRYGNGFRLFVNGLLESTATNSLSVDNGVAAQIRIGSSGITGDADWAGYIDDLRITKGIARYTSNFTPPTTAFLTL